MEKLRKIEKSYKDEVEVAVQYYKLLFLLNGISLSDMEINLIAFSVVRGTLSSPPMREEFLKRFNTNKGTMYNILSRLQKIKIIVRDAPYTGKYKVNPSLIRDFSKPMHLYIKLQKNESSN